MCISSPLLLERGKTSSHSFLITSFSNKAKTIPYLSGKALGHFIVIPWCLWYCLNSIIPLVIFHLLSAYYFILLCVFIQYAFMYIYIFDPTRPNSSMLCFYLSSGPASSSFFSSSLSRFNSNALKTPVPLTSSVCPALNGMNRKEVAVTRVEENYTC